jgi:hypothetical protein
MELGIGMFGDNHHDEKGNAQPAGTRLRELIEEIKLMDKTGIDFLASANTTGLITPCQYRRLCWLLPPL